MTTSPTDRRLLPNRLRWAVLTRDDFTCQYCGATRDDPGVKLEIDHVTPVILGGTDEPSNLVTACSDCNSGKSSTAPTDEQVARVADDAFRWAAALQQAADEARTARDAEADLLEHWVARWRAWTYTVEATGEKRELPLPIDWESSVTALLTAGADIDTLIEFIDVAMRSKARDLFKYFCGCGWKHVRALQARAREIVAGNDRLFAADDPGWSRDDDVCDVYWTGHVQGYNDGFEDGWEQGTDAGRTHAESEGRLHNEDPLPLADLLGQPQLIVTSHT